MQSLLLRAPWPPCRKAAVASDPRSCQPVFRPEAYICSTSMNDIRDGVGEVRSSSERSGSPRPMATVRALAQMGPHPRFLSR